MFRKAQLRLFGIITAILLAIFIGVLSSVNLIMGAVMERQSKDVLRQIDVPHEERKNDVHSLLRGIKTCCKVRLYQSVPLCRIDTFVKITVYFRDTFFEITSGLRIKKTFLG